MDSEILLIDKEAGWTSFDVVAFIRSRISKVRNQNSDTSYTISEKPITNGKKLKTRLKVGHAGTLDPFATGLLIILVGEKATKRQDEFMKQDKEYEATLELGKTSTTGDPEGEISEYQISNIQFPMLDSGQARMTVERVLKNFIGEIDQIPPAYSAIKINGKKAYELARKRIDPKLKSRKVQIHNIEITAYEWPFLKLKISCSSGTYIRSLAPDIGEALGVSAYLTELRRTKIGKFDIKNAKKIREIIRV